MTASDLLKVEQIAEILGYSKNTIQRKSFRERTDIPLRKKGKRLYSIKSEFKEWCGRA